MKEKDRAVLQNQLNKKRKHPPGAQARPKMSSIRLVYIYTSIKKNNYKKLKKK